MKASIQEKVGHGAVDPWYTHFEDELSPALENAWSSYAALDDETRSSEELLRQLGGLLETLDESEILGVQSLQLDTPRGRTGTAPAWLLGVNHNTLEARSRFIASTRTMLMYMREEVTAKMPGLSQSMHTHFRLTDERARRTQSVADAQRARAAIQVDAAQERSQAAVLEADSAKEVAERKRADAEVAAIANAAAQAEARAAVERAAAAADLQAVGAREQVEAAEKRAAEASAMAIAAAAKETAAEVRVAEAVAVAAAGKVAAAAEAVVAAAVRERASKQVAMAEARAARAMEAAEAAANNEESAGVWARKKVRDAEDKAMEQVYAIDTVTRVLNAKSAKWLPQM